VLRSLAATTVAAEHGGFVLLVGGSSVGKTRTPFEAVRAVLPEWWLIHPDPAEADAVRALAAAPTPRTVVWLDELQRYLTSAGGLSVGLVRNLIAAGTALVATLWPDEYTSYTTPRAPANRTLTPTTETYSVWPTSSTYRKPSRPPSGAAPEPSPATGAFA
jgi:hypothetical protein